MICSLNGTVIDARPLRRVRPAQKSVVKSVNLRVTGRIRWTTIWKRKSQQRNSILRRKKIDATAFRIRAVTGVLLTVQRLFSSFDGFNFFCKRWVDSKRLCLRWCRRHCNWIFSVGACPRGRSASIRLGHRAGRCAAAISDAGFLRNDVGESANSVRSRANRRWLDGARRPLLSERRPVGWKVRTPRLFLCATSNS